MRTATPATLIPKPVPVGLHVSRKDFYRMGNKSRQFRRNCRRNIDKCRNVDIRPLNGKTKDREVPCWKFAWSETKDRLYSVSNALPPSRARRRAGTFCRGCDFQQCKFLLLFNQLPRSCHDLGPKPTLADLLRILSRRKMARHSLGHDINRRHGYAAAVNSRLLNVRVTDRIQMRDGAREESV